MRKPVIHLICNAHLDPVWQWRWDEGAAETITTFGIAVRLLREFPTFVFNHNEAILYRWVQEYDPALFKEIQKLVVEGRWCISGGWDLQPDVNMPGTESLIRHVAEGRQFFLEHFGARPVVAYQGRLPHVRPYASRPEGSSSSFGSLSLAGNRWVGGCGIPYSFRGIQYLP
jgi:alpha-mannosidase